jgi:ElaB/YqjD/DUF883 family membrane-anchored ribosome-binding protein
MSKDCKSCSKEDIGCSTIQNICRDIDDLKKSRFWKIALISAVILTIGLVAISIVFWRNLLQQPIMLAQMESSTTKDVTELFNNQLSSMLTLIGILMTIFGFILPLINIFYQRLTLKDERESMQREVDLSLEIIKDEVREFKRDLAKASEERKEQFDKVRSDLAIAISNARSIFQEKTDSLKAEVKESKEFVESSKKTWEEKLVEHEDRLEKHEKNMAWESGFFMQQLAMSTTDTRTSILYYSNALSDFCKYYQDYIYKERLISCLAGIQKKISTLLSEKTFLSSDENSQFVKHLEENISYVLQNCDRDPKIITIAEQIMKMISINSNKKTPSRSSTRENEGKNGLNSKS